MGAADEGMSLGIPADRSEREVILGDGASEIDGHIADGGEFLGGEKITDLFVNRAVQDVTEGSLLRGVLGDQDHGAPESRLEQFRSGEEEKPSERLNRLGIR